MSFFLLQCSTRPCMICHKVFPSLFSLNCPFILSAPATLASFHCLKYHLLLCLRAFACSLLKMFFSTWFSLINTYLSFWSQFKWQFLLEAFLEIQTYSEFLLIHQSVPCAFSFPSAITDLFVWVLAWSLFSSVDRKLHEVGRLGFTCVYLVHRGQPTIMSFPFYLST